LISLPIAAVTDMLKYPISFCFIGITLSIPRPITGCFVNPFFVTQLLLGPVIHIGFHLVSLPCRLSGALTVCFGAIVLVPVAGNKELTAVNTGNLVHIVAPFISMNKNNYMGF
jgi:hypothetical protein